MKVLLIDDHTLFREGLRLLLERLDPPFDIVEANHCSAAFALLSRETNIGMVLLDLALPDMPGLDALQLMRERWPHVPVVVLSATSDRPTVLQAINRGAMGFIPKSSDSQLLRNALRLVLAQAVYVPPCALTHPFSGHDASARTAVNQKSASLRELGLTERQIQVLALLVQGLPNKLVARTLDIGEATVKCHVTACLRALNVNNRTQAVLAVGQLGYTFR